MARGLLQVHLGRLGLFVAAANLISGSFWDLFGGAGGGKNVSREGFSLRFQFKIFEIAVRTTSRSRFCNISICGDRVVVFFSGSAAVAAGLSNCPTSEIRVGP